MRKDIASVVVGVFAVVAASCARTVNTEQEKASLMAADAEWAKVSNIRPSDYERAAERNHREVGDLESRIVGGLMIASTGLHRPAREASSLHGRLMDDLKGWSAARQ